MNFTFRSQDTDEWSIGEANHRLSVDALMSGVELGSTVSRIMVPSAVPDHPSCCPYCQCQRRAIAW